MTKKLRVVHYLNQFFGGIGGEEKADTGPRAVSGAVGPGRAIENALGERGEVVATVICGDNYFGERIEQAAGEIIELIRHYQPDIVIAGPAFEAGRYGVACGALCKAVKEKLNIPCVTGIFEENPGVEIYHKDAWIVRTGNSIRTMSEAISRMVDLALKLATGQKIGKPSEDNYFPRGIVVNEMADRTGAERVVDMLLKKLRGEPFETEVVQPKHLPVAPASRITNIDTALIALVTDGGLVPAGNPDKIEASNATKFGEYSLSGVQVLASADYDVNHGGYDTTLVKQDPNRLVPVDAMRQMEKDKVIGKLYEKFFTTAGVSTRAEMARKFGQAIAAELKAAGVSGVILTSTWGTSTRCGAVLAKELERAGIPVAHITAMTPVALGVSSIRVVQGKEIVSPLGNAKVDAPTEKTLRLEIIAEALKALQTPVEGSTLFQTHKPKE